MFINDTTIGENAVLSGEATIPSPLFASFIQGKSLEDFKALCVAFEDLAIVEGTYTYEGMDYYLLVHIVGEKVSFSGTFYDDVLHEASHELLDAYYWTTPATIEEINEFTVEL